MLENASGETPHSDANSVPQLMHACVLINALQERRSYFANQKNASLRAGNNCDPIPCCILEGENGGRIFGNGLIICVGIRIDRL